jgi:hypothetical protein
VRTARLRYAQAPKNYIASAPQGSASALRADGRYNPAACDKQCFRPAAQSCRAPCPKEGALRGRQGAQHHCFPVHPGQWHWSVGKALVRHAKPPHLGSLSHRVGQRLGAVVVRARYGHPLRFYITPHCPQCLAVTALKLHLCQSPLRALAGEGNRRYAKWPSLGEVAQSSALPGRFAPYAPPPVALVVCWRCGIYQALCALFLSAAPPCILYWPPPTPGLACFAASPARSSRPPPKGAPSEPRVLDVYSCFYYR